MSTIFISHSSHDNEAAIELERQLDRQGHTCVFLDLDPEKGIVAGQSWERTLYRKLRACRAVIALCSDRYLKSHWCFAEIALARMEGKTIFALKLEQLSEQAKLPSILMENQFIDLKVDSKSGYRRLFRGLDELELLGVSSDWNPKDSPYLGLSAYQEKHAAVFFGRESESRAAIELLDRGAPGLIMTLGASGSGKSSLVRAGIIPRLRRDTDRWIIVEPFRPQTNPFLELANALLQTYRRYAPDNITRLGSLQQLSERLRISPSAVSAEGAPSISLTEDKRVQRLINQLEDLHQIPPERAAGSFLNFLDWSVEDLRRICEGSVISGHDSVDLSVTTLVELAMDLCRVCDRRGARVLIVVDQFEELLGFDGASQCDSEFLALLRQSIECEGSPIVVLGTMRTDFLAQFQRNAVLRGVDFESLSLGPVKTDSLRKIIESPAKLSAVELENGLTDLLLEDTEQSDALPLLSFTLWVLWRDYRQDGVLSLHEYQELGGLHGAIAREANALLSKDNETALKRAFLQMARITEEGQYARRPVDWEDEELQPVHEQLERFVDRRLLVSRSEGNSRTVEVAHEALFQSWQPLKNWLDEHRAEMLLQREITREAMSWRLNDQSKDILWRGARLQQANGLLLAGKLKGVEREFVGKGVRRRKLEVFMLLGIALAVFVGMAGLTIRAEQEKNNALKETARAELEKERATTAEATLSEEYLSTINLLSRSDILKVLIPGAEPGEVGVVDKSKFVAKQFDKSLFNSNQKGAPVDVVLFGEVVNQAGTGGKVVQIAHDGFVANEFF